MESQGLVTRAGLQPSSKEGLPYEIRTEMAEEFLQEQANTLAHSLAENVGKQFKWDLVLYTSEVSRKFLPFVLVIPDSAIVNNFNKEDENVEEIFQIKKYDRTVQIQQKFYDKFLKPYMYDKDDIAMFKNSSQFKYNYGLSRSAKDGLISLTHPKVVVFDGGRTRKTLVFLDPLRVFHAMLSSVDDSQPFKVDIESWKKLETGRYSFKVVRYLSQGRRSNYKKTFVNELNARIRGN